jgi:hypothetical protein
MKECKKSLSYINSPSLRWHEMETRKLIGNDDPTMTGSGTLLI